LLPFDEGEVRVFGRFFVSTIIVIILSTQLVAGFGETGRLGWPLLPYPMYSQAHFEGDRLNHDPTTWAVLVDSSRVEIKRSDLAMDFMIYFNNVVQPIRRGELDRFAWLLQRYCAKFDNKVTKLEVQDLGIAIGRDGPVEGLPPQVLYETEVTCP
jgi:hypothetical protein